MQIRRYAKKIRDCLKSRKGFTLVEVLVTLLIFSVLFGALNAVLLVGNASWQTNYVQVQLQQELRKAMHWMKHSIQQTGSASLDPSVPINAEPDPITYPDPTDDPAYDWTTYTTITFEEVTGVNNRGVVVWNSDSTQFVVGEDLNGNSALDSGEDISGNGVLDVPEDTNDNDVLDAGEDTNGNGQLDAGAPFQRIIGTEKKLIAENIESMQVRRLYDSSDIVEVTLQAQKGTLGGAQGREMTLTLDFKIQLRN